MKTILFVCNLGGIKANIVLSHFIHNINMRIVIITDFNRKNKKYNNVDNIICIRNNKLDDYFDKIKDINPDIIVSCGWGKKISENILKLPSIGAINCHGSYLPDYKGASIFKHYWSNFEKFIGVTIHYMTKKFDEGNIITQYKFKNKWYYSPKKILIKQSKVTSILLLDSIKLICNGYKGYNQEGGRYFCKMSNIKHILWYLMNLLRIIIGLQPKLSKHKIIKE